ncbi:hypothetical protein AV530_013122 [Patagioenas fasciata monilis]|uniref:Uncharacterized protein n=1 Tax=Patagioenas fasciata monilis TaxID=372326 RepID=A0A1V4J9Y1_PATFA|nr:hypothetical protein AV530_013122 [Patagioenas fasciata monilis]
MTILARKQQFKFAVEPKSISFVSDANDFLGFILLRFTQEASLLHQIKFRFHVIKKQYKTRRCAATKLKGVQLIAGCLHRWKPRVCLNTRERCFKHSKACCQLHRDSSKTRFGVTQHYPSQ